jgi:DNA invertase Pin-like site-specific DNA recombinase
MTRFVSYVRVSTQRQGASGLGLDAQKKAVADFLAARPGSTLVAEFVEVETGSANDRVELASALHMCKLTGATLLIAKLDRLSRNAVFLMSLQEAGTAFTCCDMPEANEMVIGIMAVMAQHERKMIAARTKAALAAAKAKGRVLGSPANLRNQEVGRVNGREQQRKAAERRAESLKPIIEDIRRAGHTSLKAIAAELAARQIKTPRGGEWGIGQVANVLKRLAA